MLILNGHVLEPGAPEVTLLNRSFKYGDGLFETLRVYQGHILFLPQHLQRLNRGMERLGYAYEAATWLPAMTQALQRSLQLNQIDQHGRLRLHVYRAGPGAYAPLEDTPYYLIEAYALKHNPYVESPPLHLTVYADWSIQPTPLSGCKTAAALPYVLAARHARQTGHDQSLLLNGDHVVEADSSNVFLIAQQKLITPPLSLGGLPGVMRETIMQVAREVKVPVQEKKFRLRDLRQAEEVFLTNVVRGIQPVGQLDGHRYAAAPGPLTSFLQNCLRQYIEKLL
jgi:branched-chain amino acid aminotransferase